MAVVSPLLIAIPKSRTPAFEPLPKGHNLATKPRKRTLKHAENLAPRDKVDRGSHAGTQEDSPATHTARHSPSSRAGLEGHRAPGEINVRAGGRGGDRNGNKG